MLQSSKLVTTNSIIKNEGCDNAVYNNEFLKKTFKIPKVNIEVNLKQCTEKWP